MKHLLLGLVAASLSICAGTVAAQGARVIAPSVSSSGAVASIDGNLDVFGTINGDAVSLRGDVIVHRGGRVRGDAIALVGQVRNEGGRIDGRIRSIAGRGSRAVSYARPRSAASSVGQAFGWLAVFLVIGVGTMLFAAEHLDRVVVTLRDGVGRSFWGGLLGGLAVMPTLVALVIGLAVTIVGIVFIPLAIFAFLALVLGVATLGFIAVARMTGRALTSGGNRDLTEHGADLRALVVGVSVYIGIWIVAGVLSPVPLAGAVARMLAVAVTFVAFTTGFGAVVLTRFKQA